MSDGSCFFSEFLATGVLVMVILAATDKHNAPPPSGLLPLVLFLALLGIGAALGAETGMFVDPIKCTSKNSSIQGMH